MDYKTGERLTKYRKKYGYSQEALAEKLGVSRQAISKWETGESAPDTDNLIALAKLYNVKIDDLLNVDPEDLNKEDNKNRNDRVIINDEGIHVTSDDREIKIDSDGIFVNGQRKKKFDNDEDEDEDEEDEKQVKVNPQLKLVRKIIDGIGFGLALIAYILLGTLLPDGLGWAVYWTLFFIPGIIDSIFAVCMYKKLSKLNIVFIVLFAYLFVGMRLGIWHPTWVEFLAIPVFYGICKPIENYTKDKNKDKAIEAEINE